MSRRPRIAHRATRRAFWRWRAPRPPRGLPLWVRVALGVLLLSAGAAVRPTALHAQMRVDPDESPLSAPPGTSRTTTFTLQTDDLNRAQNALEITCDGAVVSCSTDPWVMIQSGSPVTVTVNYSVSNTTGATGTIDVAMTDQWTGETVDGSVEVTVQSAVPRVTADSAVQYTAEQVNTNYPWFHVQNFGDTPATYTATVTCSGTATDCSVRAQPPSEMAPGASTSLIVDYRSYLASAGNGSITLTSTSQFGETSSHTVTIVPLSEAVSVTTGAAPAAPQPSRSATYPFTIAAVGNNTSSISYALSASCTGALSCGAASPTSVTIAPGSPASASVLATATSNLAGGSGSVALTASYTNTWGQTYSSASSYSVTVPDVRTYTVGVSAPAGATDYFAEQASTSYTFSITNSGNTQATYSLTVPTCTGTASGCTFTSSTGPTASSVTLAPGASVSVPVYFTTLAAGQNGTVALAATYGGTSATSPTVTIVPLSEAVQVTPDGATAALTVNGTTVVPFTIHETGNSGAGFRYALTASCSGSIVGCTFDATGQDTMSVPPAPGADQTVEVTLHGTSDRAGGYGAVSVIASYNNGINPTYHDEGSYGTTLPDARTYTVGVSAPGGTTDYTAEQVSTNYVFTVTNDGNSQATYTLSVPTCTGTANGCTPSQGSVTLAPGASANIPVNFTTLAAGQNGTVVLRATYGSTTGTSPTVTIVPLSEAVQVTPDGGTATLKSNTMTTVPYTILETGNSGTGFTYTVTASCTGAIVSCTFPSTGTATITLAPNPGVAETVPLSIQATADPAGGTGMVTVIASTTNSWNQTYQDQGSYTVAVPSNYVFGVKVAPDTATIGTVAGADTSYVFRVTNTGNTQTRFGLSATCTGTDTGAGGCTLAQDSITVDPLATVAVPVALRLVSASEMGSIVLRAASANATDSGFASIVDTTSVRVSLVGTPAISDRRLCLTVAAGESAAFECGDLRIVHPLMMVRTLNKDRRPTLIYNSQVASPHPIVSATVTLPWGSLSSTVTATLTGPQGQSYATQQWAGWSGGASKRIALSFDASSMATGVYPVTLSVTQTTANGSTVSQRQSEVVVVNRSATSPGGGSSFGSGWWLAGLEQLYPVATDTLLWVDGDGSTAIYSRSPGTSVYRAPAITELDSLVPTASGYTRWAQHGVQIQFDSSGRHVATVDRLNHQTKFTYSGNQLQWITVPSGTAVVRYQLQYTNGWLSKAITPWGAGRITTVNTDAATGRISSIVDPNSDGTLGVRFTYDGSSSRIASRTDRLDHYTYFAYDPAFRLDSARTPLASGAPILRYFRAADVVPVLSGPSDSAQVYSFINGPRMDTVTMKVWHGPYAQPAVITDAVGNVTTIRYDGIWPGLPRQVIDAAGHSTYATYDAHGNITTVADSMPYGDGRVATTRYEWDPKWDFVTKIVKPENDSTTFAYDSSNGNQLWMQPGSSASRQVGFAYANSFGLVSSTTQPIIGSDALVYDPALGNISTITTPLGYTSRYYTDEVGRDTLVVSPTATGDYSAADSVTVVKTRVWINQNDVAYMTRATGGGDTVWTRTYLNKESLPDSISRWTAPALNTAVVTTRWTYDWALRKSTEKEPDLNVQSFGHDAAGNQTTWTTLRGNQVATTYDSLNRMVARTGGPNGVNTYQYDALGHLTEAWNDAARVSRRYYPNGALSADTLRTNIYAYYYGSDFTRHVYGLNYSYDLDGRRTALHVPGQLAHAAGDSIAYGYDLETGVLATVTDPMRNVARYGYDDAGRLTSLTRSSGTEQWTYDADGRMVARVEGLAGYEGSNYNGGALSGVVHDDSLTYDARGKVTIARTLSDSTNIDYRPLGPVSRNFNITRTRLSETDESYSIDGIGQVASKDDHAHTPTTYTYERNTGRLLTTNGGVVDTNDYDPAGNVIRTNRFWTPPIMDRAEYCGADGCDPVWVQDLYAYGYSDDEMLTGVTHQSAATNFVSSTGAAIFAFDYWDSSDDFDYDALGRRVITHSVGPATGSNAIQRTVWDGNQVLYEIHYPAGQGVADSVLEYDTTTISHANPCGNGPNRNPCGLAPGDSGWTADTVTYDGGSGRMLYVYGNELDAPVSMLRYGYGSGTSYYPVISIIPRRNWRGFYDGGHVDGPAGVPIWPAKVTTLYRAQVVTQNSVGWFGSIIRSQRDPSGVFYMRNRYYEPVQGRFTQQDPIGIAGGLNVYGFGGGDPVTYSDPFGLCPIEKDGIPCAVTWGAGGTVAGGVGGAIIGGVGGSVVVPLFGTVAGASGLGSLGALVGGALGSTLGAARDVISGLHVLRDGGQSPSTDDIVDGVRESGASVTPHPTKTGEGTLIKWPDGSTTDIRVENHPLPGSKGKPVQHGNVDHWDPDGNKVIDRHIIP